jgi:NADH-quinone oxidoreductase subunit H
MTALFQQWGLTFGWAWFWSMLIGILVIALPLMLAVAMIIYAERKIWAAMALRRGPNVVGPWGLLQSFADGLKVFLKETIIPTSANKGLFLIAPIITFTPPPPASARGRRPILPSRRAASGWRGRWRW